MPVDPVASFLRMLASGRDDALLRFSLGNAYMRAANPQDAVTHLAAAVRHATDGRAVLHTDAVAAFPWLDVARLAAEHRTGN